MTEGLCEVRLKKQGGFIKNVLVLNSEKCVLVCGRVVISRSEQNVSMRVTLACVLR